MRLKIAVLDFAEYASFSHVIDFILKSLVKMKMRKIKYFDKIAARAKIPHTHCYYKSSPSELGRIRDISP